MKITNELHEESIQALHRLINCPSFNTSDGLTNPPFGEGIQLCLEEALAICEELGMTTYLDPAGFYGYGDYGSGADLIGVLCHLDVVPAGDLALWKSDPFHAVTKDGIIYGRGSQDDKGPTIASLYAFKAVVDAGYTFNKRIRFVFGTDEETLWRCMAAYNQKEEAPTMGFVPDGTFPLVYAEKGLLQVVLKGAGSSELALVCGDAFNVVPGKADYQGDKAEAVQAQLAKKAIQSDLQGNMVTVTGKAVHTSLANTGMNAINLLAQGLVTEYSHSVLDFLTEKVGNEANGASIFGEIKDEVSGELTFNVGLVEINPAFSEIKIDMRVPVTIDKEILATKLAEVASDYQLEYHEFDYVPSLYVPKDTALIETLLSVYREATGDLTEPIVSGGATFARTMKNMVAFGAHFPDSIGLAHQVNEGLVLSELYKATEIYAETIKTLCCDK
ncbi:M20 family metallopeptidase [Carnobacterium gallinarum]|uniref:M20 family metallopeptidase n=1 Tax=Carnobacterium gallinarum TaxID=2749 RepID=UPI000555BA44|nr:M20 family metallopeptidase [Carnobacterium gallinarum]